MNTIRTMLAVVGLLLLWDLSPCAAQYIHIGSWNIENLGDPEGQQVPAAIAQHIQLAGVDVLALQEIWDTDNKPKSMANDKLSKAIAQISRDTGQTWKYRIFANRTADDVPRHTGVAWNSDRLTIGKVFRIPVTFANEETWKRVPHAVEFSAGEGRSDFVLIPIHMKSNYRIEGLPAPMELRRLEAAALNEALSAVRSHFAGEKDIIILGDTNCLEQDEPALAVFRDAFVDLNAEDAVTYDNGYYRNPFDRILLSRGQPEGRFAYQYVLRPAKASKHESRLSDHWLVLTAMRELEDDD